MAEVGSKRRILIVDDEAAVCALLGERLGPAGFDCQTSSSGEDGLEILAFQTFDAIISGLNFPGGSGL